MKCRVLSGSSDSHCRDVKKLYNLHSKIINSLTEPRESGMHAGM